MDLSRWTHPFLFLSMGIIRQGVLINLLCSDLIGELVVGCDGVILGITLDKESFLKNLPPILYEPSGGHAAD